jgi:hypothetical protein
MSNKSSILYELVFQYLKRRLGIIPSKIMSDYEMSMRKAVRKVWTKSVLKGCYFHYLQAVRKRIKSSKYLTKLIQKNKLAYNVMMLFHKLPLLPFNHINNGYEAIIQYQKFNGLLNSFENFNNYFSKTWKNKFSFSTLCISKEKHKTNNFLESFNSKVKKIISKNPSIYTFLSKYNFFFKKNNEYIIFNLYTKICFFFK